jgi:hypothetical protein
MPNTGHIRLAVNAQITILHYAFPYILKYSKAVSQHTRDLRKLAKVAPNFPKYVLTFNL